MKSRGLIWLAVAIVLAACAWLLYPRGHAEVARIAHADAPLQAAARKAQESLPQFIRRLEHPKAGERFAVKGGFPTPQGTEYLWIKDPKFAQDFFTGTLDQQPIAYLASHKGAQVRVARRAIFDWLIRDPDGKLEGGFTEKALGPGP